MLALAIWGVAYAIMAFKGTSGQMADGSAEVTKGIEDMGSGANEALANLGESLDLGSLLDSLGSKIGEKIRNFDLGEAIHGMIQSVAAKAVNFMQDAIDIGTNLIDGISTAISKPDNVAKIKGCIVELGKALLESFKLFFGIHSPSTVMQEQGGFILDGLFTGLKEFPGKVAEWVSGLGESILGGVQSFFGGVVEKGTGLASKLGEGIQNGKAKVAKKASELGEAALNKVNKAKEWSKQALSSANSYGAKLSESKNPIQKAAGAMITGATNQIMTTAGIFQGASRDAASRFSSAIQAGRGPAAAAGSAMVAGAKSAFSGIVSSFYSYGIDAANGFKNGISNMISSIAAKAAELVRRAKTAAKNEQHSNSPSKDFMEYGNWAAEGYAIGMTNRKSTRLVEGNARKMVDIAKSAASSMPFGIGSMYLDSNPAMSSLAYAMSQISDSMDDTLGSDLMIRPVIDMSNVNSSASIISALFGDKKMAASMDVVQSAQNDFDRTMYNRMNAMSFKSIDKLSNSINAMNGIMNSRSLNNYINIDGSADPEAFPDGLIRSFRLNARTV